MARRKLPRPTDAELNILRALWRLERATVRDLQDALGGDGKIGYTTVLKNLQIMTDKGLVKRNTACRPQVYRATLSEDDTQRQLVGGLMERAFGGSAFKLVMHALSDKGVSGAELEQIRDLLDEIAEDRP